MTETRKRAPLKDDPFKGMKKVTLKLPVEARPGVFQASRITVQQLTARQRAAYRLLFDGLEGRAELENGRRVTIQGDTIRWMLERVADAAKL